MSEVTEVYSCKKGQQLKEGKLDVVSDIYDKEDAQADAKQRCMRNNTIYKVAYYRINDMGDFRIFYSYTNPHVISHEDTEEEKPKKKKRRRKKKKLTLLGKIKKLLE